MYQKTILPFLIILMLIWAGCGKKPVPAETYPVPEETYPVPEETYPVHEETYPVKTAPRVEKVLPTLIVAAKSDDFKLIRDLLAAGANVNVKDEQGRSALWYAFEYESFEAFRALLENGATVDFISDYETDSAAHSKLKFYNLAEEYELFYKIKRLRNDDLTLFDIYFSKFSSGYYLPEVERMFEKIVRNDYNKSVSSGNTAELRQFVEKYSALGQNYYLVVANDLNIRFGESVNTLIIGKYVKGEKIFARAVKGGWIQTDRGWINAKYTKRIKKSVPVLQPYLQKAALKLGPAYKPPVIRPTEPTTAEPRQPKIEPRRIRSNKKVAEIEKELDRILENPTLPKLEAFIDKYKNNQKYHSVVKRARKKYKMILLRDL
ncbi:ankyrin repeat domain-containing protein [Desulfobacterales bacterium HSG2]|nr:ankyrin repeat domain-containing protein [Desulfobacterales bacterium HSG2]